MPILHCIEGHVIGVAIQGRVPPWRIPAALETILSDPTMPDALGLLLHDRGSTCKPSYNEVRELARLLARFAERFGRRAAVVAALPIHYGIARMLAVFAQPLNIDLRVFRNLSAAEDWLRGKQP